MTIDELRAQLADKKTRLQEIDTAAEGRFMSVEETTEWNTLNSEIDEGFRLVDQLEARAARMGSLVNDETATETVGGPNGFNTPSARATRGGDIYDLTTVRRDTVEVMCRDLRDRAMRSIEGATFPPQVEHSRAQTHVESLINRFDNPERQDGVAGEISRRILATGSPIYKRAFAKTLGGKAVTADEQRALSVGTGASGGFAIVYTLDPTIIPTSNLSVNPYREFCSVETIAGTNEWRGVTSAGVTSAYAAEAAAATDNSPTLAQPSLVVAKAHCFIPVSIELTQDWGSIEADLSTLIMDSKDDLEATQFTTGTYGAATNPGGLITGATTTVTTGGTAAFTLADLYKLWESLPPRFRARASFLGNLFVYDKIRQFDTAGGAGLWLQNLTVAAGAAGDRGVQSTVTPSSLLGKAAYESTVMASALTSANKILAVGDGRYFKIIDRVGMDIEVIPHLFGASQGNLPTGSRGFYAYWRNTAKVLDPNGWRVLVTA